MNKKNMQKCPLCGNEFQYGPHRYEGHQLNLYGGFFCCDTCWNGSWDGWNSDDEKKLLKILAERNLPIPERNAKGWLPRE